jgi:hypothetical protein
MRALVAALDAWVVDGTEPPPSVHPTLADGTLTGWSPAETGWPALPGVVPATVIQRPPFVDRGPAWESDRVATLEPPVVKGHYALRVPAVDADGNERGTLDLPAVAVLWRNRWLAESCSRTPSWAPQTTLRRTMLQPERSRPSRPAARPHRTSRRRCRCRSG